MSSLTLIIEPLYVVDTHALIWYLTNTTKLGGEASSIFAAAEHGETLLIIPAIVLAEMYYANQKHHWFTNFTQIYMQMKAKPYFRFLPLEPDQVLDFDQDTSVPEMHDRIIVGIARRLKAPLLTMDQQIVKTWIVPVVW